MDREDQVMDLLCYLSTNAMSYSIHVQFRLIGVTDSCCALVTTRLSGLSWYQHRCHFESSVISGDIFAWRESIAFYAWAVYVGALVGTIDVSKLLVSYIPHLLNYETHCVISMIRICNQCCLTWFMNAGFCNRKESRFAFKKITIGEL